jgi:hypothetical protein
MSRLGNPEFRIFLWNASGFCIPTKTSEGFG